MSEYSEDDPRTDRSVYNEHMARVWMFDQLTEWVSEYKIMGNVRESAKQRRDAQYFDLLGDLRSMYFGMDVILRTIACKDEMMYFTRLFTRPSTKPLYKLRIAYKTNRLFVYCFDIRKAYVQSKSIRLVVPAYEMAKLMSDRQRGIKADKILRLPSVYVWRENKDHSDFEGWLKRAKGRQDRYFKDNKDKFEEYLKEKEEDVYNYYEKDYVDGKKKIF